MNDLKKEFGKRLAFLRKRKGLTQNDLAGILDCDLTTISKMERGLHGPRFPIFEEIVDVLGAHPREFFDFPWPPKRRSR